MSVGRSGRARAHGASAVRGASGTAPRAGSRAPGRHRTRVQYTRRPEGNQRRRSGLAHACPSARPAPFESGAGTRHARPPPIRPVRVHYARGAGRYIWARGRSATPAGPGTEEERGRGGGKPLGRPPAESRSMRRPTLSPAPARNQRVVGQEGPPSARARDNPETLRPGRPRPLRRATLAPRAGGDRGPPACPQIGTPRRDGGPGPRPQAQGAPEGARNREDSLELLGEEGPSRRTCAHWLRV